MMDDDSPFYLGFARKLEDPTWFCRQPMGKNTLYTFVRVMCEEADIQGRKTNHSARKTTVTALVHENIPDTRIMQLSGHKNVQSINTYSSASIEQQKEMSNILSKVGTGQTKSNNIVNQSNILPINNSDMPDEDDLALLSASQEAEILQVTLKDITNFESNLVSTTNKTNTQDINLVQPPKKNEMPEIINENFKGRVNMFSGATITGNVTINFPG